MATWHIYVEMGKLAIFAGLFASLASVFSKLAFDSKTPISFLCFKSKDDFCEQVIMVSRITCFSLVILSNVGMWLMFTKALQEHSTAAQPTVINSACNFLFSSVFGWLLFGESLSLKWWAGFSLIVTGFTLMMTDTTDNNKRN